MPLDENQQQLRNVITDAASHLDHWQDFRRRTLPGLPSDHPVVQAAYTSFTAGSYMMYIWLLAEMGDRTRNGEQTLQRMMSFGEGFPPSAEVAVIVPPLPEETQ